MNKQDIEYMALLFKPNAKSSNSRKVWSIDLESVWVPYFTASNTVGVSNIPNEALGAPLRLAFNPDGSVKFAKSGKPIYKVAKPISDSVKLIRENFIAELVRQTDKIKADYPEQYQEQIKANLEAGAKLKAYDKQKLDEAMTKIVQQALAHAETTETKPELVNA